MAEKGSLLDCTRREYRGVFSSVCVDSEIWRVSRSVDGSLLSARAADTRVSDVSLSWTFETVATRFGSLGVDRCEKAGWKKRYVAGIIIIGAAKYCTGCIGM